MEPLNINCATKKQMLLLPGLAHCAIQAILDYRQTRKISVIDDVGHLRGVDNGSFNIIKEHCCA